MSNTISPETMRRLEDVLGELPAPMALAMLSALVARPAPRYPDDALTLMAYLSRDGAPLGIREPWCRTTSRPCCSDDSRDSVLIWTYDDDSARRRRDFAVSDGLAPVRPLSIGIHNPHGDHVDFAFATVDIEDAKQIVNRLCVAIASATEQQDRL